MLLCQFHVYCFPAINNTHFTPRQSIFPSRPYKISQIVILMCMYYTFISTKVSHLAKEYKLLPTYELYLSAYLTILECSGPRLLLSTKVSTDISAIAASSAICRSLPKPRGHQKQVDIFLAKYLLLQYFCREDSRL